MIILQSIAYNYARAVLAGAALLLIPSAIAMAQTSVGEPLPEPGARPSVESYSLPPGPGTASDQNIVQGPVDAEIPLAKPPVVTPRAEPVRMLPETGTPATGPAAEKGSNRVQQPVVQPPPRPSANAAISASETAPPSPAPAAASDDQTEATGTPAIDVETATAPPAVVADPAPATAAKDWPIFLVAVLFFILLGAIYFWRARLAPSRHSVISESAGENMALARDDATAPERLQPAPVLSIGFQPRSANATLFNAVLGFELTLSNQSGEMLTGISARGIMDQAGDHGARDSASTDHPPFGEIAALQAGETGAVIAEFRIPLASIRPIIFRSQALFVPQVQISIAFTDGVGAQHVQTAAFLVGQEHQPPRRKMAPFRLDMGPRSFAPLGHRPLVAG